ncbi:MAG: hypothetical protein LBC86_07080 [Oscillospiraceae bacterium]|jgi:hypothetical protein|nr:hypothetical protein [Oscillospiraceae bacterium]
MNEERSLHEEVFDFVLARALKEDFEREVAQYENEPCDHIFDDEYEKGIDKIRKMLRRKDRKARLKQVMPKLATAAAVVIMVVALGTNPAVRAFTRSIIPWIEDDFIRHEFRDDVIITPETFNHDLRPTYLPEGFRIQSAFYSHTFVLLDFIHDKSETDFVLRYTTADGTMFGIYDGYTVQHFAAVHGREAIFYVAIEDDLPNHFVWAMGVYRIRKTKPREKRVFLLVFSCDNFPTIAI